MRVFKQVPRILFGNGSLSRLAELFPQNPKHVVFIVDAVHEKTSILKKLKDQYSGHFIVVDVSKKEPSVNEVDDLKIKVLELTQGNTPDVIIGVGGGSTMDLAKGTAIVLNNPGPASDYQGWDLVKLPAVYKIGIPTISGSGSEASRTAVFYNQDKKFGMNSDNTMFDCILLDPDLIHSVPKEQEFWTGMDCYIHSVESISGTLINDLARAFAQKGLELSRNHYLVKENYEELMVASYMGGASIVNSEVGICHALSYGLSLVLGYRHGIANCIAFDVLEEYYGDYVLEFREMMKKHNVELPRNVCSNLTQEQLDIMITMTFRMEKPLTNALGPNWKDILTAKKVTELYSKM